jgi:hypothetical protein
MVYLIPKLSAVKFKIFLFAFLLMNVISLKAQSNNDYISTLRLGVFKINSSVSEIEKTIGKKILLPVSKDEYFDTTKLRYNNSDITLVFNKVYQENERTLPLWKLYTVISENTQLKTKGGVGIGSTKAEVLLACDKMDLSIYNDYYYKEKNNPKDKIQMIVLNDYDAGTAITLTTEDRKVKKIQVSIQEEYD